MEGFASHSLRVLGVFLENYQRAVMCHLVRNAFYLPQKPDFDLSSHSTCLTKALHPRSLSLRGRPDLGRLLVVPNLFNLSLIKAPVLLGTLNAAELFWVLPQSRLAGLQTILSDLWLHSGQCVPSLIRHPWRRSAPIQQHDTSFASSLE